jgi:hypothetical protein
MRKWVKVSLVVVATFLVGFLVLAGIGAFFVIRHLDQREATEADTLKVIEGIRKTYEGRPPLVEIINAQAGDVRINRLVHPSGRKPTRFHILSWKAENGEWFRTEAPIWLLRFSALNVLSSIGLAPAKYRLTAQDVERYGPGIVVDYGHAGVDHVLLWVD